MKKAPFADGKPVVKSFSFKQEFEKEYNYISKLKNSSDYVCKLIKEDRERQEEADRLEKELLLHEQTYKITLFNRRK